MITRETYQDIGRLVREEVLKVYREDSCIATSKATLELVKQLHVDAYALPVVCMIANEPLWRYADEHGVYPAVGSAEYPEGGYGVGVGMGVKQEGRWPGHLVVIAERKWLLDFSLDQATREDQHISLGPQVISVSERWLRRTDQIHIYQAGSVRLHYMKHVGEYANDYKNAPDWAGEHAPTVHVRKNVETSLNGRVARRRLIR